MRGNCSFIPGWYAILPSKNLKKQQPIGLTRFDINLVLWRSQEDTVHCFLDRCPHRGAKLSIGKIKNNCLECPYHSFQFNTEGECILAPEFDKPLHGLKLNAYPVKESMNMIWIYYGEQERGFHFTDLEEIHASFATAYYETAKVWNSHITYCIENQLDYTHLPSVHKNTIGRSFVYPKNPKITLDEEKIGISFHNKDPVASFYFPNTWVLHISKKMKLIVYFSPINENETVLYLRSYNTMLKPKLMRIFLGPIVNKINKIILNQDERVVASQGELPSYLATTDNLMKHDRAIRYFRAQWLSKKNCMNSN